jgi:tetratricopeptide (TPR) repeat protein
LKAVALYERALATLQKRRLSTAAVMFKRVIDDFPDERELHERCRRYLEVCARETTPDPTPETLEERIYAATLALNAGTPDKALEHLEAAAAKAPDSDHVQYMLAVAQAAAGETKIAVTHLSRAIELNPDNRFLARNEPSFETIRENTAIRQALSSPPGDD